MKSLQEWTEKGFTKGMLQPRTKASDDADRFSHWIEDIRGQYWRGELSPEKEAVLESSLAFDFRLNCDDNATRASIDRLRELIRKQNGNLGAEDEEALADIKRNVNKSKTRAGMYKRKLLVELEEFRVHATAAGSKKIDGYFGAPTLRICNLTKGQLIQVLRATCSAPAADDVGQLECVAMVARALECRRDTCHGERLHSLFKNPSKQLRETASFCFWLLILGC